MTTCTPIKTTKGGFAYAEFWDRNNMRCSIQDSSLATEDCIWLGIDDPEQLQTLGVTTRMHLSREVVSALLPLLTNFAETGTIICPRKDP